MTFKRTYLIMIMMVFVGISSCRLFDNNPGIPINENIWVNAYLASWQHDPETQPGTDTKIKTSEIDWDAMTHLTFFSLNISEDGTPTQPLDSQGNFNSERLNSIVPAAHAHDKLIIFSVGGGSNFAGFNGAIKSANRPRFIQTLEQILVDYDFDGVNLSIPPFIPDSAKNSAENEEEYISYRANFKDFTAQLYESFQSIRTGRDDIPLITLSALRDTEMITLYAELHTYFDQINILTYDMVQPWRGWQTWHGSALYNKDAVFDDNPFFKFPSAHYKVEEFLAAGIVREKLGITINFYGAEWTGVNLMDKWSTWPTQDMAIYRNLTHPELTQAYNLQQYEWDGNAKVPYLNLQNPKRFVSFENDASIQEKIKYAKENRIGGVMLWDLGGGFYPDKEGDEKEPLLNSVKKYAFTKSN